MKTRNHLAVPALLTAVLLATPSAQAEQPGGPPHEVGILCLDGANRLSGVKIELFDGKRKAYAYPFLGYYTQTVCRRLSEIGINVGQVVEVHHRAQANSSGDRPCNGGAGRYLVKNNGSNQHVFAQVGGRTVWDSNCTIKTNWGLPPHAYYLIKY